MKLHLRLQNVTCHNNIHVLLRHAWRKTTKRKTDRKDAWYTRQK